MLRAVSFMCGMPMSSKAAPRLARSHGAAQPRVLRGRREDQDGFFACVELRGRGICLHPPWGRHPCA